MENYPMEVNDPKLSRKKYKNIGEWKRNVLKRQRYSAPGRCIRSVECKHRQNLNLKCDQLSPREIKRFYDAFYTTSDKLKQDAFIIKYTKITKVKRRRPVNEKKSPRQASYKYFMAINKSKQVQVCRDAFLKILGVKKHRVEGVLKRFFSTGLMPEENRGGDRRSHLFKHKKENVKDFIKKFKTVESHYCRNKSQRVYLQSDLNIQKMWRLYQSESSGEMKVTRNFFRHTFNTCFNIGFGSPKTDECSTCISYTEQLKRCRSDDIIKRRKLQTELDVHKRKAKAFYELLKEKEDDEIITISFDCQKNQVLPRVSDQSAYYSRQNYMNNFTIVADKKVVMYYWNETEQRKGSNEISSALYNFLLNQLNFPSSVTTIRICCDGCGGQNKNTTVIGMLCFWLSNIAPPGIENIEVIFPMVGHSFLPSDRVFGRIEKDIKKKNTIINPEEYIKIFAAHGQTVALAPNVYDWKNALSTTIKPPSQWHFQFNKMKRFIITKCNLSIKVRGERNYKLDTGNFGNILRKNKRFSDLTNTINVLNPGVSVASQKIRDVYRLLVKHFGESWTDLTELAFYKNFIPQQEIDQGLDDEFTSEPCCDPQENNFV